MIMDEETYMAFADEVQKIAGESNVGQLLSNLAKRQGLRPSLVPGIKQVQNIAESGNRQRAAQVASNVRSFLKNPPKK